MIIALAAESLISHFNTISQKRYNMMYLPKPSFQESQDIEVSGFYVTFHGDPSVGIFDQEW